MKVKFYTFLLFVNNIIAIVVTEDVLNFTDLTNKISLIRNISNITDDFSTIEAAALFEYQFMCIVVRDTSKIKPRKALDIVTKPLSETIMCGGAIIHKDWVLSVARCFQKQIKLNFVRIYAGIVDLYGLEGQQLRSVKSISIHPRFDNISDEFNIAMLKVSDSFTFTRYVNRINLPSQPMVATGIETCYTLKFIRGLDFTKPSVTKLYKVQRRLLSSLECQDRLSRLKAFNIKLSENNFCLVSLADSNGNEIQGACRRDMGDPCICGYNLHGLISNATLDTCYRRNFPTTITDVGAHLNWIRSQILELHFVRENSSTKIFKSKTTVVYFLILLHLKLPM